MDVISYFIFLPRPDRPNNCDEQLEAFHMEGQKDQAPNRHLKLWYYCQCYGRAVKDAEPPM
jgi:hypothetical protein